MSFYQDMAALALDMLTAYGRTVTIKTPVMSGDPYNPTVTWTTATARAVSTSLDSREVTAGLVLASDQALIIEPGAVVSIDCRIADGGDEFSVVRVMPLRPGDTNVLTRVTVRK